MLRPFHFVFLFVALAILALSAVADEENLPKAPSEVEPQADANGNNDLEADATFWGYRRPYYGGWGGYSGYGRGYGGWGGWRRGWGGRGYYGGRGWGGWGGYYYG